ncbi:MAG TPA: hypothetical protein VHZ29_02340 [Rhizomicrobium sp.]|jgi:hypothetical protein|nr:hypothetical protein [Rhizomicrobium sp.]
MDEGQPSGSYRYATSIAILVVTLAVLGLGALTYVPRSNDTAVTRIGSPQDLASAFARVQPGRTRASQLAALGFDTTTPNVQVLSYLGVMERYASASTNFDKLDAALQNCIEARNRCTAFVFKPGDSGRGGSMFASLGFGANAANRTAEVTLLVENGRVAYKTLTGMPQQPAPAQRRFASPTPPRPATEAAMPVAYRSLY